MPDPKKVHSANLNSRSWPILLFFMLLMSAFGLWYAESRGVPSAVIYLSMLSGGFLVFAILSLAVKNDNTLSPVTNYARIPFSTTLPLSAFMYVAGSLLPIIVTLGLSLFASQTSAFSVVQVSQSFSSNQLSGFAQSFNIAEISLSPAWKLFFEVYVAGTVETFVFNFALPFAVVFAMHLVFKLLNRNPEKTPNLILFLSLLIVSAGFIFAHTLNSTYVTPTMFLVAGGFLLLLNYSIYYSGFFLIFWLGYHQVNNLIYLFLSPEFTTASFQQGFISVFGVLYVGMFALVVYYMVSRWPQVRADVRRWWNAG